MESNGSNRPTRVPDEDRTHALKELLGDLEKSNESKMPVTGASASRNEGSQRLMTSLEDIVRAVTEALKLDQAQTDRRKTFLELGDRDVRLLHELHARVGSHRLDFLDAYLAHLRATEETRALVEDPSTVAQLNQGLTAHFQRMTSGSYDWSYVLDQLRSSAALQRLGLPSEWSLCAYQKYLCSLLPAIWRLYPEDPDQAIDTVRAAVKVVFFDVSLAVDAFRGVDREAWLDTESYSENVLASVPSGMLVLRADLSIVLTNRFFRRTFDVGSQVVGRSITDVLSIPGLREHALGVLASGKARDRLPFELQAKDGSSHPLEVTLASIRLEKDEGDGLLVLVQDLTTQQRIRTQAGASLFRELVENATEGIVMVGEQDAICYVNQAAEKMFGYTRNSILGRSLSVLMSEDHSHTHEDLLRTYLAAQSDESDHQCQVEWLHRDGTTIPIECTVSVCPVDGEIIYAAMLRDVSGRVRAEDALKRSEQGFRTLIEQTPDAIAVHRRGRFVYVNPSMVRLLGYTSHTELVDRPLSVIVHPEDAAIVAQRVRTMMGSGALAPPQEERFVRRDGTIVHAEVVAMPLVYEGEPAIVAIGRDITERKQLTARVMQMDRMLAVGTLAAGVGHEINNPLSYVVGNVSFAIENVQQLAASVNSLTSMLRRQLGDHAADELLAASGASGLRAALEEIEEVLGDAREGSDRIRDIVRDLRTFSRSDDAKRGLVDVHGVIESAINMAFNEIRHRARLVKDFGEIQPVAGNESRLGQVFLNLLVNAAHAIEEGAADRNEIRIRTFQQGGDVTVEVRDTGKGIQAEDLPRLFDPFFTTKPVGQGTGLGLSICRQTVDAIGGRIEVESVLGGGSLFRVVLPAVTEPMPTAPTPSEPAPKSRRSRILVIDDEPMIARFMRRAIGKDHNLVTLAGARPALQQLRDHEHFDLIFCDLMMPDMTGMEFYEELHQLAPEQAERVIFMTGGAFTPGAREFLERVSNLRLDKPFDQKNIRALVRDLLR